MQDANVVSIAFQGEVSSLQQGAAEAARSIATFEKQIAELQSEVAALRSHSMNLEAELKKLREGGRGGGEGVGSLETKIRSLKNEMVQGDRTLNFFMRSMGGLVPVTGTAAEAIRLLADGLIGGMGLGLGIQAVAFGFSLLAEHMEAAEKAERAFTKATADANDAIDKEIEALRQRNLVAGQAGLEKWQLAQLQIAENQQQINEILQATGTTQEEIDYEMGLSTSLQNDEVVAAGRAIHALREKNERLEQLSEKYSKLARGQIEGAEKDAAEKRATEGKAAAEKAIHEANQAYWRTAAQARQFEIAQAQTLADLYQGIAKARVDAQRADQATLELAGAKANEALPMNLPGDKDPWVKAAVDAKKAADEAEQAWTQSMERIGEQVMTTFEALGTGQKKVGDVIKGVTKDVLKSVLQAAIKSITASAYSTGAKAAESQAATPVIGPALAAGAMAAGIGMVLALVDRLPSAAGGMLRVPGDMLAQIHKDESVIPAREARALRVLLEGGGALGGGPIINIHALDLQSFVDALSRHDASLMHVVGGALRRGLAMSPLPEGIG